MNGSRLMNKFSLTHETGGIVLESGMLLSMHGSGGFGKILQSTEEIMLKRRNACKDERTEML